MSLDTVLDLVRELGSMHFEEFLVAMSLEQSIKRIFHEHDSLVLQHRGILFGEGGTCLDKMAFCDDVQ